MSAEGHAPTYRCTVDPFCPRVPPLGGQVGGQVGESQSQGWTPVPAHRGLGPGDGEARHRPRPPRQAAAQQRQSPGSGRTRAKNEAVSHYCVPGQGRLWLMRGTERGCWGQSDSRSAGREGHPRARPQTGPCQGRRVPKSRSCSIGP